MKNTKLQKYYPWIVVALLWVVALLNYMDRQMLSTMRESMQVDIAELEEAVNFGRLMAIFLWIYGLVSPVAGAVADRISRKWLIVGSLGVWSAVTLLMGYSTSFGQIYWLRALMGISEALYIPASLSLIADYHTGKARSFAIGVHMTGLYVGQAVGGFGATVASMFSGQETFHWFGIIGIAYAVVLIFFLHENRGTRQSEAEAARPKADLSVWRSFGLLLSNIAFWVVLFYFASSSLPGWATKNWLPTLFADSLGDYFPGRDGRFYGIYRYGDVCILLLDCGEDKPDDHAEYNGLADYDAYRAEECAWLKKAVRSEEFLTASARIVLLHIPPAAGAWHGSVHLNELFVPVLNEAGIDLMLCGHDHRYSFHPAGERDAKFPIVVNDNRSCVRCDVADSLIRVRIAGPRDKTVHTHEFPLKPQFQP